METAGTKDTRKPKKSKKRDTGSSYNHPWNGPHSKQAEIDRAAELMTEAARLLNYEQKLLGETMEELSLSGSAAGSKAGIFFDRPRAELQETLWSLQLAAEKEAARKTKQGATETAEPSNDDLDSEPVDLDDGNAGFVSSAKIPLTLGNDFQGTKGSSALAAQEPFRQ